MHKRKTKFSVFVLLFFVYSVSNVFALGINFIERASFNEDKSGIFSIKVDLTQTGRLVSIIKYLNKDYGDIAKFIDHDHLCVIKERFKKIPDINEVRVKYNKEMLTFTIKFKFKNIQALNKAMRKINKGIDPPKITYFSLSDELFVREDINGIAKKLILYQKNDNCLVKSLDLASFFKGTTYTTVYTFHKKIERFSHPLGELTTNKKTIQIKHHIFADNETEESIGNRIHFEKIT
ncbi:hypothetical protein [Candidatus Cardinium hertigii]|nr:hypothetical protein [Candidatus Cardinium hertigii]